VVNFIQTRLQSSLLQFNLMIFLITLPGYALLIFSLIEMLRNYQLANDPIQRNRYRYVMASTGIFLTGMLLSHSPLGKYPVEIFGSILSALLMTYSTLKNNLADIDVVIRRSILYTIPTTVIGAGYFLIITLTLKLFNAMSGLQLLMISMIVAIPSAILSQPLQEKIQSWIDRAFFKDKHESGLMLQRISGTATTFLEVNMLANMILDEISATMHIQQAAFLLKDKASKEFRLIVHRNLGKNTNIRLRADHPIVLRLSISDKVISKRDTDLLPQFKSLWDDERTVLDQIGAELYIPLRSQGELIGILAVGNRYSDRPYTKDDQATLTTLGNQVAVAIENARLYTTEQNRRKELDSLYTLSRKLIATDAMQSVTENIVEHALESVHTTFARLLLRNEDGSYICKAVHPVFGLHFDLKAGKLESIQVARYYDRAIQSGKPLVLDRHLLTLTFEERKSLFLEQVQSLCICPLRIGEEPLGVLVMGERRNPNRESFDADKLRLASAISDQASSAIWRARLHDQLEESFVQTILALANTIDAKDMYTSDHSERLATLATITARKLNCSPQDIQAINWAMHLHDIGKIGVPDEILQKPGPLNDAEWQIMRLHPEIGAKIIAPIKNLQNVVPLILHHHERFDGTGYPGSLQGENIPLGARILTVVDTYGAITDNRVYRKARSHEEAMQEIERCAGTQFDPKITAVFKEVIEDLHIKNSIPKQRNLSAVRIHDTVFPGGRGE
jgi:HD-GYP domain-containing protein (c-di-GMP phosphodiesterase class II)